MAKMLLVDDNWKTTVETIVSSGIIIAVSRHRNRTINLKAEVIYVIKLLVAGIPNSDRTTKFNIAPSRFGSMKRCRDGGGLMLQSRWSDTPSYHHQYFIALSSSRHRAINFRTSSVYKRNGVKYAYPRCTVTDSKHNFTFPLFLVYLKLGVLIFLMIIKASKSIFLWWWRWGGGVNINLYTWALKS